MWCKNCFSEPLFAAGKKAQKRDPGLAFASQNRTVFSAQIICKMLPIFASRVSLASLSNPFPKLGQHLQEITPRKPKSHKQKMI